ncbi:hypothetical protein B0H19DRAFT_1236473 [Mycena capillaripes]|nr:hypothetical protein B0H19DRAFT_1236473 [Mycena capillaripes]
MRSTMKGVVCPRAEEEVEEGHVEEEHVLRRPGVLGADAYGETPQNEDMRGPTRLCSLSCRDSLAARQASGTSRRKGEKRTSSAALEAVALHEALKVLRHQLRSSVQIEPRMQHRQRVENDMHLVQTLHQQVKIAVLALALLERRDGHVRHRVRNAPAHVGEVFPAQHVQHAHRVQPCDCFPYFRRVSALLFCIRADEVERRVVRGKHPRWERASTSVGSPARGAGPCCADSYASAVGPSQRTRRAARAGGSRIDEVTGRGGGGGSRDGNAGDGSGRVWRSLWRGSRDGGRHIRYKWGPTKWQSKVEEIRMSTMTRRATCEAWAGREDDDKCVGPGVHNRAGILRELRSRRRETRAQAGEAECTHGLLERVLDAGEREGPRERGSSPNKYALATSIYMAPYSAGRGIRGEDGKMKREGKNARAQDTQRLRPTQALLLRVARIQIERLSAQRKASCKVHTAGKYFTALRSGNVGDSHRAALIVGPVIHH